MTMSGNLKQKCCGNDTEFKLKVVHYANNCNRQTALEFNVSEKQVQDWRKVMLGLAKMPRAKKAHRGESHHFPRRMRTETKFATTDKRITLLPVALLLVLE